jgi:hypothetical protein
MSAFIALNSNTFGGTMTQNDTQPDHELFHSIKGDVTNLHMYWKVYRQLFAVGEQRIALLNETGPLVFFILQHLLLDEVTLGICRLTDPPGAGEKKNHSLPRLCASLTPEEMHAKELQSILKEIHSTSTPFRERRNRAIAHSDLAAKLKIEANPVPGISREMVETILGQMRHLMNSYEQHHFSSSTFYDVILPLGADDDFLTEQLKRAVAFRDLERSKQIDRDLWTKGRYRDA